MCGGEDHPSAERSGFMRLMPKGRTFAVMHCEIEERPPPTCDVLEGLLNSSTSGFGRNPLGLEVPPGFPASQQSFPARTPLPPFLFSCPKGGWTAPDFSSQITKKVKKIGKCGSKMGLASLNFQSISCIICR
eukprot:EG_transcript_30603